MPKSAIGPFVTIAKRFDFDAAHRLPNVPDGHKCGRMHGHTYVVELQFSGVPNPHTGMLFDYADIAALWAPLNARLDHYTLNDIPGLENPTTEVLVHWMLRELKALCIGVGDKAREDMWRALRIVRVYESSTTYCEAGPYAHGA